MHYTHVEIGVCDYDRLIDQAPPGSVGLSVEPVPEFFDKLPVREQWATANVAIGPGEGITTIHYISREKADLINKGEWVSGCAKVGVRHPELVDMLHTLGLNNDDVFEEVEVPSISIEELWRRYEVSSIDYLKIDTEGMDCQIVAWVMASGMRPRRLQFETNSLTPSTVINATRSLLERQGYTILQADGDTIAELIVPGKRATIHRRSR